MAELRTFQEVLADAVADIVEHGYDSMERIERWTRELRLAAEASLVSPASIEQQLRDALALVYRRLVDEGGIFKHNPGVDRFTLEQIKPHLRAELDRRISASASLIKSNRDEAVEKTLRRFQGWSTSVPKGGVSAEKKKDVKATVRKSLASLPFEERRVLIDQGHKMTSTISEIVAADGGAIAGRWRSNWRQAGYDYREDHKERDEKVYLIRDSWAHRAGLVKRSKGGYLDEIDSPATAPFCRCLEGSTEIFHADGVSAISRRHYDGPCLEIVTSAFTERPLVITPNHPVLTARGWVSAETLKIGDDLLEFVQEDISARVRIDDKNDHPSTIAEIFETAAKAWGILTIGDSRLQFHGDGTANGNVDIVRPTRPLSLGIGKGQGIEQFSLAESNRKALGLRPVFRMLNGLFSTAQRGAHNLWKMGCQFATAILANSFPASFASLALPHADESFFLGGPLAAFEDSSLRMRPDFDANFSQASADCGITDFEVLCENHGIAATKIRATKVLDIKRRSFSGHVYNLETKDGWYSANRIITHNCYYIFLYNLRDLPPDMLTQDGRRALVEVGMHMSATRAFARADAADDRETQAEAKYMPWWPGRPTRCGRCSMFRAGADPRHNGCEAVEGDIALQGHCRLFEIRGARLDDAGPEPEPAVGFEAVRRRLARLGREVDELERRQVGRLVV